jgi:hypothetical protein
VTDRVDTPIEAVQATEPDASRNLGIGEPERPELIAGDDAVLTCGKSGKTCVDWWVVCGSQLHHV